MSNPGGSERRTPRCRRLEPCDLLQTEASADEAGEPVTSATHEGSVGTKEPVRRSPQGQFVQTLSTQTFPPEQCGSISHSAQMLFQHPWFGSGQCGQKPGAEQKSLLF